MNNTTQLNYNNIKTIISLNKHLISLKDVNEIFKYLSSYLKEDFNIYQFSVKINNDLIFMNCKENEKLSNEDFIIKLNQEDQLTISIFYFDEEFNVINDGIDLIKTIFNILSQTIYNKYLEYKLKKITLIDTLTGLYNRQYLDQYLRSALPLSRREDKKIGFLKIGIDHFKAVIDEFDYLIGDKVVVELAKTLEEDVRTSDIIARVESDEFLVILHNIVDEENAIMVAEKIINHFKDLKVIVNDRTKQTLMKTLCVGIAIYPDDAERVDEIFRSSDIALYEAKNKGRSTYFKFQKESDTIDLF
ncbi:MAG: GGDEF domain-containing protein [Arcobacter sp.]|nr:GGDEF domain-containing protein [Arcobacter sp.]